MGGFAAGAGLSAGAANGEAAVAWESLDGGDGQAVGGGGRGADL